MTRLHLTFIYLLFATTFTAQNEITHRLLLTGDLPTAITIENTTACQLTDGGLLIGVGSAVIRTNSEDSVLWSYQIEVNDATGLHSPLILKTLELSNGELLAFGQIRIPGTSNDWFTLFYFDNAGTLLDRKIIGDSGCSFGSLEDSRSQIIESSSGTLVIIGSCSDFNEFIQTTLSGDVSSSTQSSVEILAGLYGGEAQDIIEHSSGGFYTCGHTSWAVRNYVTRYDQNGNVLWQKRYQFDTTDYEFASIIELPDQSVLIGSKVIDGVLGANEKTGVALTKLDTAGNVIWSKIYEEYVDGGMIIRNLALINDSTVIGSYGGDNGWDMQYVITDTDGNLIDMREEGYDISNSIGLFGLIPNQIGGITTVADAVSYVFSEPDTVALTISRQGSNLPGSCFAVSSLITPYLDYMPTIDTSLLISSSAIDTLVRNVTLTNLNWSTDDICELTTGTLEDLKSLSLKVYPNPTSGNCYVEISDRMELGPYNFELTTLSGQKVDANIDFLNENSVVLNLSKLVDGFYILRYHNKDFSGSMKILKQK